MTKSTINDSLVLKLLNESQEINIEAQLEDDKEEETFWHQKFSNNVKSGIGALTPDNFSEAMVSKLSKVKVMFSPIWEKTEQKETKEEYDKLRDQQGKSNFATNLLVKVTRTLQKVVANHSIALDFLQQMVNKLDDRLSKVEAKADSVDAEAVSMEIEDKMKNINEKVEKLEKEKEILEQEVDKARQWGMKGNLILSSKREMQHMLEPKTENGGNESPSSMCRRLIEEKTGVVILEEDILACHRMGREGKRSYIVKILNHKTGTGWETLVAGMAGRGNFRDNGIFINFQLTEKRNNLLWNVRKVKTSNLVKKFRVDQNDRIWVTQQKGVPGNYKKLVWLEVDSLGKLKEICPDMELPVAREQQQRREN